MNNLYLNLLFFRSDSPLRHSKYFRNIDELCADFDFDVGKPLEDHRHAQGRGSAAFGPTPETPMSRSKLRFSLFVAKPKSSKASSLTLSEMYTPILQVTFDGALLHCFTLLTCSSTCSSLAVSASCVWVPGRKTANSRFTFSASTTISQWKIFCWYMGFPAHTAQGGENHTSDHTLYRRGPAPVRLCDADWRREDI